MVDRAFAAVLPSVLTYVSLQPFGSGVCTRLRSTVVRVAKPAELFTCCLYNGCMNMSSVFLNYDCDDLE